MTQLKPLTTKELTKLAVTLPDWKINAKQSSLSRTFMFNDPVAPLTYCAKVMVHAEMINHHPKLTIDHTKLKIDLTTHDLKALSHLDVVLAQKIDNLIVE